MNKKYHWLKLKDDFFSAPQIKKLRKLAGGDTYTIIYQKIMLLSIKTDGIIEFQKIEKTLAEELSLILDEDVDNIKMVLSFMKNANLIENLSENEFLLPSVINLIGSETSSAERMRKMREKRNNVTQLLHVSDKIVTTEKEKEKEKDIIICGTDVPLEEKTVKKTVLKAKENNNVVKIYNHWEKCLNKTYDRTSDTYTARLQTIKRALAKYSYQTIADVIEYKVTSKYTKSYELSSILGNYLSQNIENMQIWLFNNKTHMIYDDRKEKVPEKEKRIYNFDNDLYGD